MRLVILTWRKSKRIRRAALDLGQTGIAIPRTIQLLLALFEVWQVVVVLLLLIMPTFKETATNLVHTWQVLVCYSEKCENSGAA